MSTDVRAEGSDIEPTLLEEEPSTPDEPGAPGGVVASETAKPALERPRALPVAAAERYFAVDALRGCALLGILAMNIVHFGWPQEAYGNPMAGGGFEGADRAVWFTNHLVFEEKMMTIFSMLFGAGLVLMDQRAIKRGASIRGVYYRRVLWLLAIGMVHAYLIWSGDILVLYAQCGLFLYFFRNLKPRTLIITGVVFLLLMIPVIGGLAAGIDFLKATAERVEQQIKVGETPSPSDKKWHDFWKEKVQEYADRTPEKRQKDWNTELDIYRGGYFGIVKHRAPRMFISHILEFFLGVAFFAGGRMLLGMGLMKLGVFSAERCWKFYTRMMVLCYGIGLPLMIFDALELIDHKFSGDYQLHGGMMYNAFGSIVVALGHVGLIMLVIKSEAFTWLTRRLAAVGRMALSNYLTHSILCTTLFYGYGFGLFGTINRTGLAAIVLAIWVFQLLISPVWLKFFRYGPAEWIWRSLTYWRLQPMRVESPAPAAALAA